MARPKRQAERRHVLVRAARRAIAARGYSGVRIKDVADAAGLSPQTVLYYYPDVDELLVEAIRHAVKRYVERRRDTVDALDDPVAQLAATIRAGLPTDPEDDVSIIYQCVGALHDNTALRAMVMALTAQQVDLYLRILEVGAARGVFRLAGDSRSIAANLVALEDAYGLYMVEGYGLTDEDAITQVMAFAALATGVDLREQEGSDPGTPGRRSD
jgi:AcrR family transcriptional regulator